MPPSRFMHVGTANLPTISGILDLHRSLRSLISADLMDPTDRQLVLK